MTNQTPLIWTNCQADELSEANIRRLYPAPEYRVSAYKMTPGLKIPVAMRECKCFVISGSVKFCFSGNNLLLNAGYFCELPSAEFELEADQFVESTYIAVWDLARVMGKIAS